MILSKRVIIIGGNAAGLSAASQIKRSNPSWQVTVYEKTKEVSYASCGIPYFIQGKVKSSHELFALTPEKIRDNRDIDLQLETEVVKVMPQESQIKVSSDTQEWLEQFDYLVIATGASPDAKGVKINSNRTFNIKYVHHGEYIKEFMANNKPKQVGIIGGGYIALEMAETFKELGLDTTLIHRRDQLNRAFMPEISKTIFDKLQSNGVKLQLNTDISKIEDTQQGEKVAVIPKQGESMEFDMVITAIGVSPNTDLLEGSGIELGINNAIQVSEFMQTNYSHIYAAGDVVETKDLITGQPAFSPLALKANKEGSIVGTNIANEKNEEEFPGVLKSSILKVFDLGIARTGLTEAEANQAGFNAKTVALEAGSKPGYYPGADKLQILAIADTETGRLLGTQITGPVEDVKRIDTFAALIQMKASLEDIYNLDLTYAPPFSPVYDPVVLTGRVGRKK